MTNNIDQIMNEIQDEKFDKEVQAFLDENIDVKQAFIMADHIDSAEHWDDYYNDNLIGQ